MSESEAFWVKGVTSLHDGSVDGWLYVVFSVARVDEALSFRVLFDFLLHKDSFKAHIRRHGLEEKTESTLID